MMTGGHQGRGTRRLEVGNSQICVKEGNLESVVKGSERYGTLLGRMGGYWEHSRREAGLSL